VFLSQAADELIPAGQIRVSSTKHRFFDNAFKYDNDIPTIFSCYRMILIILKEQEEILKPHEV
jgi:hypothetical protein